MIPAGLEPSACPDCLAPLEPAGNDAVRCPAHGDVHHRRDGIWRMLSPSEAARSESFLRRYRTVRRAEHWGASEPAYYRALPFEDISGRQIDIWRIRAQSYQVLVQRIVAPLRVEHKRPLRVLDVGAGNGWLAHRLASDGDHVVALDLDDDPRDGLGAHHHYGDPCSFVPVQAGFDHLPYVEETFDLVVFNGALHYSTAYEATLAESLRVLTPRGRLTIIDSPFYRRRGSGEAMVRERDAAFRERLGVVCEAGRRTPANEAFLTRRQLGRLGHGLGVAWRVRKPWYGWRWALRPLAQRLRGRREPVRFFVVEGQRVQ